MNKIDYKSIIDWHTVEISLKSRKAFRIESPLYDKKTRSLSGMFIREIIGKDKYADYVHNSFLVEEIGKVIFIKSEKEYVRRKSFIDKLVIIFVIFFAIIGIKYCI